MMLIVIASAYCGYLSFSRWVFRRAFSRDGIVLDIRHSFNVNAEICTHCRSCRPENSPSNLFSLFFSSFRSVNGEGRNAASTFRRDLDEGIFLSGRDERSQRAPLLDAINEFSSHVARSRIS